MKDERLININGRYAINASDNTGYILDFDGGMISVIDMYGSVRAEFFAEDIPLTNTTPVVHGKWELYDDNEDGYSHHRCSNCKEDAIFTYEYEDMYDEGYDGEWHYIGNICIGIDEHLTKFCPHCGALMNGEKK